MLTIAAAALLIVATVAPAAFLLSRRSFLANALGFGFALEAAGQAVSLAAAALDAVLDAI